MRSQKRLGRVQAIRPSLEIELSWPGEFLGPKKAKQKRIYLRSFEEPRLGIWKEIMFRYLKGGVFGIFPLAVKMVLLRSMFIADPQRIQDNQKREKKACQHHP